MDTVDPALWITRSVLLWCIVHCSDPCLPGFAETLPTPDTNQYDTLDPGNRWRTYIFPSLRFACKGTLETLEFVTAATRSAYWNNDIGLYLSVWRPDGIAYAQVASREFRVTNAQQTWSSPLVIMMSTDVAEDDIVGVTLPPSNANWNNGQRYKGIPLLSTSRPCYRSSDGIWFCSVSAPPFIRAKFTPSTSKRQSK